MSTVTHTSMGGQELGIWLSDRYGGPPAEEVAARLAAEDLSAIRAVVSWRGVAVRPDVCSVSLALSYLDLIQERSCGRCSPCRIGVDIMRRLLLRLQEGRGSSADLDELRLLAERIEDSAWCGIANTIREPMLGLLETGAEHFRAHAEGTPACPQEHTFGWIAAPCRSTCPSTLDCPSYVFQAAEAHPHLCTEIVKEDNPVPAVIGRTCHHPCEANCTLAQLGEPIAINFIKRWAADRAYGLVRLEGSPFQPGRGNDAGEWPGGAPHEAAEASALSVRSGTQRGVGEQVAIIGAGPAGLTAGYYLARKGYRPVVFEALPVPGGMLYVGIPEYRLPKAVLRREVELICSEGVEIRYETAVGRDLAFADLEGMGFAATFIAIGAHCGKKLRIPGEDLPGSIDAIDFLRQIALGEEVPLGERVLVLGGGNSAMDASRTALRLGAREVTVVYRRAREQMPANPWEIDEAMEEGVRFHFLSAPLRCEGDTGVELLVCQPMELGPPDESGRQAPVPLASDPFTLDADTVIAAVGQEPDFTPFADPLLQLNKWGYLEVDPRTLQTTKPGVFVGGDAITGGASIIEAVSAGKTAAKYIDLYLRGEPAVEDLEDRTKRLAVYLGAQRSWYSLTPGADYGSRQKMPVLFPEERRSGFAQVELGYSTPQALAEARRCLRCHRPLLVAG